MTVVELSGGGWYTEVIAPYMNDQGTYIAAHWDPNSEMAFVQNAMAAYQELARGEIYSRVQMGVLMPPETWAIADEGSVDMVLTFRTSTTGCRAVIPPTCSASSARY